ncbi:efflux RND transporter permease subunit [Promicromonospora thailandica]|uniref:Hydrophobic/amphiphilic exporter-1, HAE1 family n=1 Tax=Promicromonospora thailandica TaxID=765201 RepID=A0A9X2FZW8_9MICO|nr:efflux RND transporter permease subunit [Promicromonospora thailandica]MCP2264487.1 hydrophobic/amphiphilic exporter-1, HAE1 family [Promicromonospora thailandica]BFF20452.1 efflux RND transporter permease subunit [Promicromonospora thailandica]
MFRLARLSLANRAVVALVTIAIAVFGVLSMTGLKQELIPSLQLPTGIVSALYPGSSPQVVEEQVTDVIEEAIASVDDVASVRSTASTGVSLTTVEFVYGTDMEAATQRLQTAVTGAQATLPQDVTPQVTTGSVDDVPVVQLAVAGDKNPNALADTVENVVVPALEDVDGVRAVAVTGQQETEVRVRPDPARLGTAGLTPQDLTTVLQDNGVVVPAGEITDGGRAWSVQLGTPVDMVDQLKQLPVVPGGGTGPAEPAAPVLVGEVATVELKPVEATSYSRLDGAPSLGLAVTKTPEANTVDVSHAVEGALAAPEVADTLTERGVTTAVVFDQAPFVEDSIHGLATEGGLGLLFAVLVILVFLMSVRSTLVSAISIPLSLAVTFIAMNAGGYTLNILTLGALTISIGRVVDDAIVVIENIKRHMSYGTDRTEAVLTAVREVGGAIAASTICTVAVFLPIAFVGGMVGELFRPFALTVSIAMLASLVVALTIVPVLAYWFIRPPKRSARASASVRAAAEEKEGRGIWQRVYVPTLDGALARPAVTLGLAVAILAGTVALAPRIETSFLGDSGQDTVTVTQHYAPGTSLQGQDEAAKKVEAALAEVPAVESVQSTVGGGGDMSMAAFGGASAGLKASFAVTLDDTADGTAAAADIRAAVADLVEKPATEVSVSAGDSVGTSSIDLVVRARDDAALSEATTGLQEAVRGLDGVVEVSNDLSAAQEIVEVTVNRKVAAEHGLTETQVTGVASAAMAGAQDMGELRTAEGPVGVTLVAGEAPTTMAGIGEIPVPTATGPVRLKDVATVQVATTPTSISRIDGDRSATVSVTPAGDDLGAVTEAVDAEIAAFDLPAGATVTVGGAAADQAEAFADLGLALLAAIALVFIVMVAAFRSLAQPFILLVSVPFAAVGALIALVATGTPLGVPALIGTLLLVGIVVSNAIVLIDLINQYRQDGMGLDEAVREGARKRLRPIVMTALATVFALTPMAVGVTGGGAFISQPLALVVIGGLVSSTLLTLYVVPVIYTIFEGRAERRRAADEAAGRTTRRPLTGAFPSVATGAFQTVGRQAAAQRRASGVAVAQPGLAARPDGAAPPAPWPPPRTPVSSPVGAAAPADAGAGGGPGRHSMPTPAQAPPVRARSAPAPGSPVRAGRPPAFPEPGARPQPSAYPQPNAYPQPGGFLDQGGYPAGAYPDQGRHRPARYDQSPRQDAWPAEPASAPRQPEQPQPEQPQHGQWQNGQRQSEQWRNEQWQNEQPQHGQRQPEQWPAPPEVREPDSRPPGRTRGPQPEPVVWPHPLDPRD